jgi:hypothetical protein
MNILEYYANLIRESQRSIARSEHLIRRSNDIIQRMNQCTGKIEALQTHYDEIQREFERQCPA